jgi:ABC-type lipopolysaccharide export system ATPase subunit
MIRARDLRKAYAKIQAVDGVSLELVAGETFGLLGPTRRLGTCSGAGSGGIMADGYRAARQLGPFQQWHVCR